MFMQKTSQAGLFLLVKLKKHLTLHPKICSDKPLSFRIILHQELIAHKNEEFIAWDIIIRQTVKIVFLCRIE